MKILVLRFSSIGDIVLTTPVVRALAQQVPGAEVHFATKPAYRGLLEPNPYVAKVHVLSGTAERAGAASYEPSSSITSSTCTTTCARASSSCGSA
ncbi:MAG: hypothetical protein WKG07_12215 [Hymenobacter sp.]